MNLRNKLTQHDNSYKRNLFLGVMNKKEFEQAEEKYLFQKKRFEKIKKGQLVWESVPRYGFEMDYHPAVVKAVNVDENYVKVIDISSQNREKKYYGFTTEEEMIKDGFSKESIKEAYKRYSKTIEEVLKK